ncbi:MAG TPA: type I-B CRISPR-associated protein Cas7/Csh2 [Fervidobacterium sp.]|nr:type I-B CRISPR-associated protein Cas7/Csh2 [Fervidobacterium sp.]HOL04164.1 type I-B CRISPR-associated protein Cas7/Csh2 [Fervidobacterium sp.]HON04567.1 type I-B CRISPR-associated protein Cas7/Csh2 [Fervidobacterium sp.]HQG02438.1 type I-B CRISPR-associated protein Cas7/Csh2 [Fervidobacterium sp.]HQI10022.1 type I-B CRISPR-associated protein Cas7/Csh2 [Fervidobacterium sp.]
MKSRKELLFVYSVKDANPNGDPLNANHPRYDEETGQVLVSDVRIKRTIRDEFMRMKKNEDEYEEVFIDGLPKTMKNRYEELKSKYTDKKAAQEILKECIDARLFGVTFALGEKETFAWTGPVQFKWGRSLHKAKVEFIQGTGAFVTNEGGEQRTIRNEYIVPFAIIATYAIGNQYASVRTGASDDDFDKLVEALWNGTNNLITRSKTEHRSRMLLVIDYVEGFNGLIGSLDERIRLVKKDGSELNEDEQLALRNITEVSIDLCEVSKKLETLSDKIEKIKVIKDPDLEILGLDYLQSKLREKVVVELR